MANTDIIKAQAITGGNLFVNGIGRLGELKDAEPPKFEHETLETNTQVGKVELVLPLLKPMSAKFVVNNVAQEYFELLDTTKKQNIYVKQNHSSMGGKEVGYTTTFEGNIKILEIPKFEMGKEAELTFEMSCYMIKHEVDGKVVLVYDISTSTYKVNGVDLYEKIRKNIL